MVIHKFIKTKPTAKPKLKPRKAAPSKRHVEIKPVAVKESRDQTIARRAKQIEQLGSLVEASVGERCRMKYQDCWTRFLQETGFVMKKNTSAKQVDSALCLMLDVMFNEGEDLSQAQYMVAAVLFKMPCLRSPRQTSLPVTKQTMQGWRKLEPPKSRLPLPWEAVCGMAKCMIEQKKIQEALMMMMCFHLYLRPGEATRLRVMDLVPPLQGGSKALARWTVILHPLEELQPSKTQEFDETLIFDQDEFTFVAESVYRVMTLYNRPKHQLIFSKTVKQLNKAMVMAATKLHLEPLGSPHPYRLRHGGASYDFQSKSRSLVEIQRRGRWKAYASVRRYEKGGRVNQLLQSLPRDVLQGLLAAAGGIQRTFQSLR